MKYSDSVNRAFKTLRSGALWGFAIGVTAAMGAVLVVFVGGAVASVGVDSFTRLATSYMSGDAPSLSSLTPILVVYGAFLVGLIAMIPLGLVLHGGLVSLTDSAVAGRPVKVRDGWSSGFRNLGRVLAIDLTIGFAVGAVFAFIVGALVAMLVSLSQGGDSGAGAVVGICCGMGFYLLAILVSVLFVSSFEALAIRYGIIGGRTFGDALSAAGKAFRARWKNVLVFALLVIAFNFAYQMASSAITIPLEFLISPSLIFGTSATDPGAMLRDMLRLYAILIPFSMLISIPWNIFQHSMWTAFFRQLTGLDIVAEAPAPPSAPVAPTEYAAPSTVSESAPAATLPAPPQPPVAPEPAAAPELPESPAPPAPEPPATDA